MDDETLQRHGDTLQGHDKTLQEDITKYGKDCREYLL